MQGCKKEFHYFCTHGADKPDNGPAGALLKQKRKIRYGMILTMILLFVVGYAFIALEHKVKVDKSAIALLMCGAIWTIFSLWGTMRISATTWSTTWATRARYWCS